MNKQQIITIIISIVAMGVSIINFIFTLKTIKRNKNIQDRNDKIEVESLLDKAIKILIDEEGRNNNCSKKDLYEAESLIRKAKEIIKDYPRTIEYEGLILEKEGKIQEAKGKYEKALTLKPVRWESHNLLGLLNSKDNYHFEQAIKINPAEAGIPYFNIANRLLKEDKLEEAKEIFIKSLETMPNSKYTYLKLGDIHKKQKNFKGAKQNYEKAISIDSQCIEAIVKLGALIGKNENLEDGLSWIEQAIKINPKDGYSYKILSVLYAELNDPVNSLKYYEKAAEVDPKYRLSDNALYKLQTRIKNIEKKTN